MRIQGGGRIFLAAAMLVAAQAAKSDAVFEWDDVAMASALAARQAPPDSARTLAMVHVAQFDAVNAIDRRFKPFAFERTVPGASPEAAAAAAAYGVLVKLYPDQRDTIDGAYRASLARVADGAAKAAGVALGEEVAAQCNEMRAKDGAGGPSLYKLKVTPGRYVTTTYPVSSEYGKVKPFFMKDPAQFRPGPPPELASNTWQRDLAEIRAMGARNSAARNAQQTEVGRFWAMVGPPSWMPVVRSLAASRDASLVENARLFAMVNMAASDAFVAVFDAKYAYEFWRPVTAIRYDADPQWSPLIDTPMHPEYPCAHCISAAAVATVLESEFGAGAVPAVAMTSNMLPGVTRRFTRIGDYLQEVSNARVWAGVHYRNSTEIGMDMGRRIGTLAVGEYMVPLSKRPGQMTSK